MKHLIAIFTLWVSLLSPAASAPALTLEELRDWSGLTTAALSPDGRHIAAIIFSGTNYGLILIDAETLAVKKLREGGWYNKGYWGYLKASHAVTWAHSASIRYPRSSTPPGSRRRSS